MLLVRPTRRSDIPAVMRARARISDETMYRRFHSPKPTLTPRELSYFFDVDQVDHVALIAIDTSAPDGIPAFAGSARAIRTADAEAEIAFLVADDYQGQGAARALLGELRARCLARGITTWVADVQADNPAAIHLILSHGTTVDTSRSGPTVRYTIRISQDA